VPTTVATREPRDHGLRRAVKGRDRPSPCLLSHIPHLFRVAGDGPNPVERPSDQPGPCAGRSPENRRLGRRLALSFRASTKYVDGPEGDGRYHRGSIMSAIGNRPSMFRRGRRAGLHAMGAPSSRQCCAAAFNPRGGGKDRPAAIICKFFPRGGRLTLPTSSGDCLPSAQRAERLKGAIVDKPPRCFASKPALPGSGAGNPLRLAACCTTPRPAKQPKALYADGYKAWRAFRTPLAARRAARDGQTCDLLRRA